MARVGISGDIIHTVGVRYRVKGVGSFQTRLYNMGEVDDNSLKFKNLDNITLGAKKNREKTALANFQDQGIQIRFRTVFFGELINLSKISLFYKPVAESYPIKTGGA